MGAIEVVRTEVGDGLSAFCAPLAGVTPSVGLTFRAGRSDETASTSGLSHLLEHLILPARSGGLVDYNGYVDNLVTTVFARGRPDDLRAFFESVAARIRHPPSERFEPERRILQAEEASRAGSGARQALALRFGPVGAGLSSYDEYGLRRLEFGEVSSWAAARFTRANAALWTVGMRPDDFDVSLPAGTERFACLDARQIDDLQTPAVYNHWSAPGICLSFVAPRGIAMGLALDALTEALMDRLRYDLGLSYSIEGDTLALGTDLTHAFVSADVADESVPEWLDEAVGVIDELSVTGVDEERLDHLKETRRRHDEDPTTASSWVAACAEWELQGLPYQTHAEFREERDAVSSDDVARLLESIRSTLLVVGPYTTPIPPGFAEYPLRSSERVSGKRHRPSGLRDRLRRSLREIEVQSSPEGVTATSTAGDPVTALYARTVLCMREDRARTLLTDDGFFLHVDADAWTDGKQLVEEIDRAIPSELVVQENAAQAARQDQVDELARSTFKRTWLVSEELEVLPQLLEDGERLLALASGSRGWNLGLLAVSDRRLRFLYGDGTKHSFVVERGPERARVDGSTLELFVDDDWVSVTDIGPKGKPAELEGLLHSWT